MNRQNSNGELIDFRINGSQKAAIGTDANSNPYLHATVQDSDLMFKGNDNGSTIDALKLDMSAAGYAIFNAGASFANTTNHYGNGNASLAWGDTNTIGQLSFSGTTAIVRATEQDADLKIQGNDNGVTIDALTFDMSASGTAIFNSSLNIPGYVFHSGDANTYFGFSNGDEFELFTAGSNRMKVVGSGTTFNEGGAAVDFRVESDNNTHMLWVDGDTDRINLGGSSNYNNTVNINGNVARGSYLRLSNFSSNNDVIAFNYDIPLSSGTVTPIYSGSTSAGGSFINMRSGGGGTIDWHAALHGTDASAITYTSVGKYLTLAPSGIATGTMIFNEDSDNIDFRIESDNNASIFFVNATSNRIGMGTTSGTGSLHIKDVRNSGGADVSVVAQIRHLIA